MEVAHRFLDHADLEIAVRVLGQQVRAHHGLVEVRGHLRREQRVLAVNHGLRRPGKIRVHRVAQLVRQRAHARHIVVEAHQDERVGPLPAG